MYTFIAPYLSDVAGLDGAQIGYVLFSWGASAFIGVMVGGLVNDKVGARSVIRVALPLTAVSLAAFSFAALYLAPAERLPVILAAVVIWGMAAWAFSPAQQARLIGVAGMKNAPIVLSLNASFQYFGFSLGALLGGVTLANGEVAHLGWIGGLCVLGALMVFARTERRSMMPTILAVE
jgi:predicted MFS family arabinose efflux permease